MVVCAVYGCKNRSGKTYNSPCVRFFTFPSVHSKLDEELHDLVLKRRRLWISRLARKDLTFSDCSKIAHSRICSKHFTTGAPAALKDTSNLDWAPSINLGHDFFNKDKLEGKKRDCQDIIEDNTSNMKDAGDNEDIILAANKTESMDEENSNENCDKSGQDRLKYFIFGSSKSSDSEKNNNVTHEEAVRSAETLLLYMQNQGDMDHTGITLIMDYIKKIKERILKDA